MPFPHGELLAEFQEGEELDDLLAEIDAEFPTDDRSSRRRRRGEDEDDEDDDFDLDELGMTDVQKRTHNADKLFAEDGKERRARLANERQKDLKDLREKLMAGTRDAAVDHFGDLLNASANKVRKTKVDVRSENAKRFRDMFDKGEVPEPALTSAATGAEKTIMDKEHELEMMRRTKRQQKEFFKKMESGQLDEQDEAKEPKLLVGKITKTAEGDIGGEVPELASLSNRFSFFEHFEEKKAAEAEANKKERKPGRISPHEFGEDGGAASSAVPGSTRHLSEADLARKECKARNVLSKFKDMETRVLNGEEDGKSADHAFSLQ